MYTSVLHKSFLKTLFFKRLMMHERNVLWNSMLQTQEVLARLKNAFDPLNSMENATSKDVEAASLLGLADLSLATVKDLKNRLLGKDVF